MNRNRIDASALLLSFALVTSGCKTLSQPQPAQPDSSNRRASNGDEYSRTYQAELHQRHRRGGREEGSDGQWTSHDRADTGDQPSGNPGTGGYPGRNDARGSGAPALRHHNSRALTSAPGQFDFYVLNLSWSPEYCHAHAAAAECAQHRAFTLHGLWPQNLDGTYPEDCSEAPGPANPSQYADIYPDPTLLQHEWQTHGTCSGLPPDQFFALARRAEQSISIPGELLHLTQQTTLTPAQIVTLFTRTNRSVPAAAVAISCGNNYLTAVELCLDKNLKAESCSAVKSCAANEVRIPPP